MVIKMNRVFVSIGPINIYWYSVLIISAILIGIHFSSKVAEKNGLGKTTSFGRIPAIASPFPRPVIVIIAGRI